MGGGGRVWTGAADRSLVVWRLPVSIHHITSFFKKNIIFSHLFVCLFICLNLQTSDMPGAAGILILILILLFFYK